MRFCNKYKLNVSENLYINIKEDSFINYEKLSFFFRNDIYRVKK